MSGPQAYQRVQLASRPIGRIHAFIASVLAAGISVERLVGAAGSSDGGSSYSDNKCDDVGIMSRR